MKLKDFQKVVDDKSNESKSNETRKLKIVQEVIRKINKSLLIDEVLYAVLQNLLKYTSLERGYIVLSDSKGNLIFKLGLNNFEKKLTKEEFSPSNSVVKNVFETGEPLYHSNIKSDTNFEKSQSIVSLELDTILCAPLKTPTSNLGVIYLDSIKLIDLEQNDMLDLFEILAGQAAIAIKNASLYDDKIKAYNHLQKTYQELKFAKESAEKSNRLKAAFLNQMSHEIRTPINIIVGYSALLKDELKELHVEDKNEVFDMIDFAGKRIIKTIEDMLEMSKIRTGDLDYDGQKIKVIHEIIKPLFEKFSLEVQNKSLDFFLESNFQNDCIQGDKYMLEQIFNNLIENAIKYTHQGYIKISCTESKDKIAVTIEDTGIGISKEYQEILFSPFTQEESGYSRSYEGNGLGLAITKSYIDVHDGTISIESDKNKGTKVIVSFDKINE